MLLRSLTFGSKEKHYNTYVLYAISSLLLSFTGSNMGRVQYNLHLRQMALSIYQRFVINSLTDDFI